MNKAFDNFLRDMALGEDDQSWNKIINHILNGESWDDLTDDRQQKEVQFARVYASEYAHGTNGHNQYILIAKLSELLDVYEDVIEKVIRYSKTGQTG